jgi:uncharacterized protein YprB with RNaseH-like and TPR domain
MGDLRRQLDDLKAGRPGRRAVHGAPLRGAPTGLAEILGGSEFTCGGLACWRVETPFEASGAGGAPTAAVFTSPVALAADAGAELDPRRAVLLDIETGGFSGFPVFLIGVVPLDARPLRVVQFLARDYPEEEGILRALATLCADRDAWITFNGKSFDEPFLRDRATRHHVLLPPPRVHIDLLHLARRAWRGVVTNCRLTTLEQEVLGHARVGDVPSSDVPDLFQHFMRTGNAAPLRPVLEHNRRDLVACVELLWRLARPR